MLVSVAALFIGFSPGAWAAQQSFLSLPGATLDGHPVSAQAEFTTSAGQIVLTLTNLIANPTSIIQAISDIFFVATDPTNGVLTGGTGLKTPTPAPLINIGAGGVVSPGSATVQWDLSNTAGTYHLDVLAGPASGPATLIIGPAGPGGVYTNANSSIAANGPHNPFINTSATFTLAIAGATAATTISGVVFSFGTTPGANVPVPIPPAVWLFGSGLLGLIAIARRRQSGAAAMPAAA